jgi:ABC-2 type transport system ATP-binding protein
MITVKNLNKSFGSQQVLHQINMQFIPSTITGIVGENGAGKTTLFHCIAGLANYEGSIESNFNPLKNYIGYLPTEPFYFNKMTGKEYLQLVCNAKDKFTIDFEAKNIFELPLDKYATTYSTGMKKKLALLGVLLQENEIYILDEPYNGVDIQSNILITAIIKELQQKGKTIIISSHIFGTLAETCQSIYVMQQGQVQQQVAQKDFKQLEESLKEVFVGNKLEQLGLK